MIAFLAKNPKTKVKTLKRINNEMDIFMPLRVDYAGLC